MMASALRRHVIWISDVWKHERTVREIPMFTNQLRSSAWLLCVFALSLVLVGQPANAGSGPVILSVEVDFGFDEITIKGGNFKPGVVAPVVTLGGVPLVVSSSTDTTIVADCPLAPPVTGTPFCADGDFLLKVKSVVYDEDGDDDTKSVAYDLTIGPTGFATDAELAALGVQVNANGAAIANLGAQVNANGAAIANLGAQVNTNGAAIANLGAQVNANGAAITNLGAQVNNLLSRVAELEENDD